MKLDEDLDALRRDLARAVAVSPPASFGDGLATREELARAAAATLADPNARKALRALRRSPLSLGSFLDPLRKTEHFDSAFRHEIGFVFFAATRSWIDKRRAITLADREIGRAIFAADIAGCEVQAKAEESIGEAERARVLRAEAAYGRALLSGGLVAFDDPGVIQRPGGSEPRWNKRQRRLAIRSGQEVSPEMQSIADRVSDDTRVALRAMLGREASTIAAYIASAACGLPLRRSNLEHRVNAAKRRTRQR